MQTVDRILSQSGIGHALQHPAFNKMRFGIVTDQDVQHFLRHYIPELQAQGLLLKNGRTQAFQVGGDFREEESTASEAGSVSSTGRGLLQLAIVFDVPPWHTEDELLEALAPAAPQPHKDNLVPRQPGAGCPEGSGGWSRGAGGSIAGGLPLWHSVGGGGPERVSSRQALARRQQQQQTGGGHDCALRRTYAAAAAPATPGKGRARGKGGSGKGRPSHISPLGPQHRYYQ